MSNFMKIRPVVAEFHADEHTNMTKLIVAFRNFRPKNRRSKALTSLLSIAPLKAYGELRIWLHTCLTLTLVVMRSQLHSLTALCPA